MTTEFIEKFSALNNTIANVDIKHILYGSQKIKRCVLHPFVDEGRIGLIINEEEIYVTTEELREVYIDCNQCFIKSDVIEIQLKVQ